MDYLNISTQSMSGYAFAPSFLWKQAKVYFCDRLWNKDDTFKYATTSIHFYRKDYSRKGNIFGRGVAMAGQPPAQRGWPSVWSQPHQQYVADHSSSLLPQVSSPGLLWVIFSFVICCHQLIQSLGRPQSHPLSSSPLWMDPALSPEIRYACSMPYLYLFPLPSQYLWCFICHSHGTYHIFSSIIMTLLLSILLYYIWFLCKDYYTHKKFKPFHILKEKIQSFLFVVFSVNPSILPLSTSTITL